MMPDMPYQFNFLRPKISRLVATEEIKTVSSCMLHCSKQLETIYITTIAKIPEILLSQTRSARAYCIMAATGALKRISLGISLQLGTGYFSGSRNKDLIRIYSIWLFNPGMLSNRFVVRPNPSKIISDFYISFLKDYYFLIKAAAVTIHVMHTWKKI